MPKLSRKKQAAQFAAEHNWDTIGAVEWRQIAEAFPGISASTLEEAGLEVEQPWRGVKQHTFDELTQSLRALAIVYAEQPDLRRFTRDQVIAAKDRAKWASRSPRVDQEKRKAKAEMAEWMLVWLDDPAMFTAWVERRRAVLLDLCD